jgi:hypothetical protein
MGSEIGQSERLWIGDEETEDASSRRSRTDPLLFLGFESGRQELGQSGAVVVEDPKCRITGARHGTGFFDQVAEQRGEVEIGLQEQGGLEKPPKLGRIFYGSIRHKRMIHVVPRG